MRGNQDSSTSPNTIRLRPSPKRTERASMSLSPGGRKQFLRSSRSLTNMDAMDIDPPEDDSPASPGRALRTRKSFSYDLTVRRKRKDELAEEAAGTETSTSAPAQPQKLSAPATPKKADAPQNDPKSEPAKRRQSARLVTSLEAKASEVVEKQQGPEKTVKPAAAQATQPPITTRVMRSANPKPAPKPVPQPVTKSAAKPAAKASAPQQSLAASRPKRVIPVPEPESSSSEEEEEEEDDDSDEDGSDGDSDGDSDDSNGSGSDSDDDKSEKSKKEDEEKEKVPKKKWATHGLYVGQHQQIEGRSTLRALKKGGNVEKTILPLPMYKGQTLMEEQKDFVLPFNIFNTIAVPPKKPPGWKSLRRNIFVGEALDIWKQKQKQAQNKSDHAACMCSKETGCDSRCLNRVMYYECDAKNCKLPDCKNRPFRDLAARVEKHKKFHDGLELIMTKDKGYGLRATRSFEPNQIIVEYCGEIITQDECDDRMNEKYKDNESYYLMEFDNSMIIDATRGSIARFVNHSCSPNCKMEKWIVSGKPRMALFAGDDGIEVGEELTYDYNFNWFSGVSTQECRCGSENCRGQVGKRSDARKVSPADSGKGKSNGNKANNNKSKTNNKKQPKIIKKKVVKASNAKVVRTKPAAKTQQKQQQGRAKAGQKVVIHGKARARPAAKSVKVVRKTLSKTTRTVKTVAKTTKVVKTTSRSAQKKTPQKRAPPQKKAAPSKPARAFKVSKTTSKKVVASSRSNRNAAAKGGKAPAAASKPTARGKKTSEEIVKEILKPRNKPNQKAARVNPKAVKKAVEAELPKTVKNVTVTNRKPAAAVEKSPRKRGIKDIKDNDLAATPAKRRSRSVWDFTDRPRVKRSPRSKKPAEVAKPQPSRSDKKAPAAAAAAKKDSPAKSHTMTTTTTALKRRRRSEPMPRQQTSTTATRVESGTTAAKPSSGIASATQSPTQGMAPAARHSISSDSFYGKPQGNKRAHAADEPTHSPKRARVNSFTAGSRNRHANPLSPTRSSNVAPKAPPAAAPAISYPSRKRADVMSNTPSSRSSSKSGESDERLSKKRSFESGRVLSGGPQVPQKHSLTPKSVPEFSSAVISSEPAKPPPTTVGWNAVNNTPNRFSFLGFFAGIRDKDKTTSPTAKDIAGGVKKPNSVLETIRVGAGLL